jgi:hypothetical protein
MLVKGGRFKSVTSLLFLYDVKGETVMESIKEIQEVTEILDELYPIEYDSINSLYAEALRDGIITKKEFDIAESYYAISLRNI